MVKNDSESDAASAPEANKNDEGSLPDAFELFEPSCRVILNNFKDFAMLLGVPFILAILSGLFQMSNQPAANHTYTISGAALALSALTVLITLLIAPGLIVLQLACVRMQKTTAGEAFQKGLRYFWKLIGLGIVLAIALVVALILFIVPFFLLLPRVVLSTYFLIDRDMGIFDAIRASNEAYKKHHGIWGIIGVNVLIYIPSIIPFIGRIVSTSLSYLYEPALALRYEQIRLFDDGKKPRTPFEAKLKS